MLVASVAIIFFIAAVSAADPQPDLVVLVHRHGARTPLVYFNTTILCGKDPCGALTNEGKSMLESLGKTLGKWYAPSLPAKYDPYVIHSRSTGITRTLQSSASFLRGLFPNMSSFYPAIHSRKIENELLMDPGDAWPSIGMRNEILRPTWNARLADVALALFTEADLVRLGRETYQDSVCPTYGIYCIMFAQDSAQSMRSAGTASPWLISQLPKLDSIISKLEEMMFPYNTSNYFDLMVGSQGQRLIRKIVGEAESLVTGVPPGTDPLPYLIEFSAHDTTLMPLYVTLGQPHGVGFSAGMRPVFAETIVFEFFKLENSSLRIRAYGGAPEQTPGPHKYTFKPFPLRCINRENGETYINAPLRSDTVNLGCPLDDFVAYINTTVPQAPNTDADGGWCVRVEELQQLACPPTGVPVNVTSQPSCLTFRQKCPSTACKSGEALNYNNGYACQAWGA
jgi:hypothetical protein